MSINFFNSVDHLQPKCKGCNSTIDYGVTTEWSDAVEGHICTSCKSPLEVEQKEIVVDHQTYVD